MDNYDLDYQAYLLGEEYVSMADLYAGSQAMSTRVVICRECQIFTSRLGDHLAIDLMMI